MPTNSSRHVVRAPFGMAPSSLTVPPAPLLAAQGQLGQIAFTGITGTLVVVKFVNFVVRSLKGVGGAEMSTSSARAIEKFLAFKKKTLAACGIAIGALVFACVPILRLVRLCFQPPARSRPICASFRPSRYTPLPRPD